MPDVFVYQIFYDEASRQQLDPGFIPLDNTTNERPDWYELWPIRRFLSETTLQDDAWYGFLSPKFQHKTRLNATQVHRLIGQVSAHADVALLSPWWDQIAYFLNVFEQGEFWHPGLLEASQRFLKDLGIAIDVRNIVTHSLSSVFSNYLIARPRYWRAWLALAEQLFAAAERDSATALKTATNYGASVPMKTFVQERLATVVMAQEDLRVVSYDASEFGPIAGLFINDGHLRGLLQSLDQLKRQYTRTKDDAFLQRYFSVRRQIATRRPVPVIISRPPKT